MSLTNQERQEVIEQVRAQIGSDLRCPKCGSRDSVSAHDDGISRETDWGVGGAYVSCDSCGHIINKTPNVEFSGGAPLHGAASAGTKG